MSTSECDSALSKPTIKTTNYMWHYIQEEHQLWIMTMANLGPTCLMRWWKIHFTKDEQYPHLIWDSYLLWGWFWGGFHVTHILCVESIHLVTLRKDVLSREIGEKEWPKLPPVQVNLQTQALKSKWSLTHSNLHLFLPHVEIRNCELMQAPFSKRCHDQ